MKKEQGVLFKNIAPIIDNEVESELISTNQIVHCRVCNRILRNENSKLIGIGSTCLQKLNRKSVGGTVVQNKLV